MKQSLRATARLFFAACFCCALAFYAGLGRAEDVKPIKLAVFDLELDDFSAGGPLAGESAEETARLRRVTALAREQLAKSGLFELVDTSASSDESLKAHWLRKCNGCEADIARALGADMSFLGFFRKISVMEQNLEFRIRDARTGELMNVSQTDYRGETDKFLEPRDRLAHQARPRRTGTRAPRAKAGAVDPRAFSNANRTQANQARLARAFFFKDAHR